MQSFVVSNSLVKPLGAPLGAGGRGLAQATPPLPFIQHLPGGDASGMTAVDAGPNGINATYTGTPVFGADGIGDGLTFVNINAASEIDNDAAALIALWNGDAGYCAWWAAINDAAKWLDANSYVMHYYGSSATYYYQTRKGTDGYLSFICRRSASINNIVALPPTTTRLCHFMLAWDSANNRILAYINGTKQQPTTNLGAWAGALAAEYGRWGDSSPAVGNNNWPGRMGKMKLGNVVPTDAQAALESGSIGQVVFEGDSRSNLKPWTNAAVEAAFPTGEFAFGRYGYASYAVSGSTTAMMTARASTGVDTLIRDGKNILVVWAGVNDNQGDTAQSVYDRLKDYCLARRAAGWNKIILCTEIDSNKPNWTAKYPQINALIAADHSFVDGVIDLGAAPELQNNADLTYFADGTHLTASGNAIVTVKAAPVIASTANGQS
jgi:hypothetical protein